MFTKPDDLAEPTIVAALAERWDFEPAALDYQPVGFGSHHWLATGRRGDSRFITVDDLRVNHASTAEGTVDAAFARLGRAFRSARALSTEAGLEFVVAPVQDVDGEVIGRLDASYSIVVHPYVEGVTPGHNGEYDSARDRATVLERIVALHAATEVAARHAGVETGFLPGRDGLHAALDALAEPWTTGPYAERARALLSEHSDGVRRLLEFYDVLVASMRAKDQPMVITHGEPHASNVVVDATGPRLVDWESALIAPPERDLWVLDPGDGSILAAYADATGVAIAKERLDWYRLWYDLFEIAGYTDLFRQPHAATRDSAESWHNLVEFLQPHARWPELLE